MPQPSPQRARAPCLMREKELRRAAECNSCVVEPLHETGHPLLPKSSLVHTSPESVIQLHDANPLFADSPSELDRFPLYAIRLKDLEEIVSTRTLEPMQEQLKRGRIHKWDPSMGKLLFISHQWLDWDHPDPDLRQLREFIKYVSSLTVPTTRLCDVCDLQPSWAFATTAVRLEELAEDIGDLWIWYDFVCVPQLRCVPQSDHATRRECEADFSRAILSIPSYVEQS
eukprot:1412780-Pleurochrysis_carterae.AAC.3